MIWPPTGNGRTILIIDVTTSGSNSTNNELTFAAESVLANYTPNLTPYIEPPPAPSAKQRNRAFTDELNHRDRKRRWRK